MDRSRTNHFLLFGAVLLGVAFSDAGAPGALAQEKVYNSGFVWHRNSEYQRGERHGKAENNPNTDALGSPVYSYEYVNTGDLERRGPDDHSLRDPDGEPWYKLPRKPLTWSGGGNNKGWKEMDALVNADRLEQPTRWDKEKYAYVPLYVWRNPAGDGMRVQIDGEYLLRWPNRWAIDLLVAHHDVSENDWHELSPTGRYAHPGGNGILKLVADPVAVDIDAGDEIVVSLRSVRLGERRSDPAVLEDDVKLTLVPRPRANVAPPESDDKPRRSEPAPPSAFELPAGVEPADATAEPVDPVRMTVVLGAAAIVVNGILLSLLRKWKRSRGGDGLG